MVTLKFRRAIDSDRLLLNQYGLTKRERLEMFIRGLLLTQFAIPIGSAIYWLVTQVRYLITYPKANGKTGTFVDVWLKDAWDRAPIRIDNLFHQPWFAPLGTVDAPTWWVTARHDARHVLIGFLAFLLVGAFLVGLKPRKRASKWYMIASVPLAFLVAMVVAGVSIAFFAWHPIAATLDHIGVSTGIPFLGDLIGKGTIQLTVIGALAGFGAKMVLARTFDTLQLMSIERNIAQGDKITGVKRFIYAATYRRRSRIIEKEVASGARMVELGSRWIGITVSLMAPLTFLLLWAGIWLNYLGGPATGAH